LCRLCFAGTWGLSELCPGLLSICLLENTQNLRLQFREFHRKHGPVWMQDQVIATGKKFDMPPQHIAETALDAIAFVRFTQHFADGQTDAWTGCLALRRKEPAHGSRAALPSRGGIGALKICVLTQSRRSQRLANRPRFGRVGLLLRLGGNAHRKLIGSRPDMGGL